MTSEQKAASQPTRLPPREVYFAWFDDLGWLDQAKHSMPLDVLHGSTEAQDAWVLAKWKNEHVHPDPFYDGMNYTGPRCLHEGTFQLFTGEVVATTCINRKDTCPKHAAQAASPANAG